MAARAKKTVRLTFSKEAEKYVRRDAAVSVRRMAARGALPLEPIELATVLFALCHDPDGPVKETARASLADLPENVLTTVLKGQSHPAVLGYLAKLHQESESYCEMIALNAATEDTTVAFLATLSLRRVIDVISNNQERMLRCEAIVDSLGTNPLTGRAVLERIFTFLGISTDEEGLPSPDEEAALSEAETEAAIVALLGAEMSGVARALAAENAEDMDEEITGSLYAVLQNMGVMQKIKLARSGGKEARALLIRDRNKVISMSVLASPKLTDTEVVGFSQSRGLSDDILRIIARNREWTKNYKVKLSLATNPKCPQPVAIRFLAYLQDKDLRRIMKSRDVSAAISTQARRLLDKKGKI